MRQRKRGVSHLTFVGSRGGGAGGGAASPLDSTRLSRLLVASRAVDVDGPANENSCPHKQMLDQIVDCKIQSGCSSKKSKNLFEHLSDS